MKAFHSKYMRRCFELARLGRGYTSPNPIVGAVLVHQGRIIGEGYHKRYGEAHAEVNAVNSVMEKDRALLKEACLYVSLEPCSIFGNTPPCTDLILRHKIPKVVISYIDHSPGVDGLGVEKLKKAGVEVILNVLEEEGKKLSAPRNIFVREKRPYIILKYAVSQDGFIALPHQQALWMTNPYSKRLVHKWRSEIDAILIGTNTAHWDDPQLNNRLFFGPSPTRLVIDRSLRLPSSLQIFDGKHPTIIYTNADSPPPDQTNLQYVAMDPTQNTIEQILLHLYTQKKLLLMVEGGTHLLSEFIGTDLWDEARVFTAPIHLKEGVKAPPTPIGHFKKSFHLKKDQLTIYSKKRSFS